MATSPYALKQRVLITDDDPDITQTLTLILETQYEVFPVTNGLDAVEWVQDVEPDLIIIDAMMPMMSGYEAVDLIRKIHRYKEIPIIMLSGLDSMQDHRTGYEHEITLYLTKPIIPDVLLKNVELELFKLGRPPNKKFSISELKKKFHVTPKKK